MENNSCRFNAGKKCIALSICSCPKNCKFAKTNDEFYSSLTQAQRILREKGLRPALKKTAKGLVMSTEEDG